MSPENSRTRRVIRQVEPARRLDFDEQLWPVNLLLVILAGLVAGVILANSDFAQVTWWRNGWVHLAGLVVSVAVLAFSVVAFGRAMQRRTQIGVFVSLLVHLAICILAVRMYLGLSGEMQAIGSLPVEDPPPVVAPDYRFLERSDQSPVTSLETPVETLPSESDPAEISRDDSLAPEIERRVIDEPASADAAIPAPMELDREEPAAPRRDSRLAAVELSRSETDEPQFDAPRPEMPELVPEDMAAEAGPAAASSQPARTEPAVDSARPAESEVPSAASDDMAGPVAPLESLAADESLPEIDSQPVAARRTGREADAPDVAGPVVPDATAAAEASSALEAAGAVPRDAEVAIVDGNRAGADAEFAQADSAGEAAIPERSTSEPSAEAARGSERPPERLARATTGVAPEMRGTSDVSAPEDAAEAQDDAELAPAAARRARSSRPDAISDYSPTAAAASTSGGEVGPADSADVAVPGRAGADTFEAPASRRGSGRPERAIREAGEEISSAAPGGAEPAVADGAGAGESGEIAPTSTGGSRTGTAGGVGSRSEIPGSEGSTAVGGDAPGAATASGLARAGSEADPGAAGRVGGADLPRSRSAAAPGRAGGDDPEMTGDAPAGGSEEPGASGSPAGASLDAAGSSGRRGDPASASAPRRSVGGGSALDSASGEDAPSGSVVPRATTDGDVPGRVGGTAGERAARRPGEADVAGAPFDDGGADDGGASDIGPSGAADGLSGALEAADSGRGTRRTGGELPVRAPAPEGLGGLAVTADAGAGIPDRLARDESTDIHTNPGRLILERSGGRMADVSVQDTAVPGLQQRDRDLRSDIARRLGGSEDSERAVEAGLEFLIRHQSPDGHWSLHGFDLGRPGYEDAGLATMQSDTAGTGLALLAFLGAGYTHTDGKYRQEVGSALAWLLEHQRADGDLFVPQDEESNQNVWLYSHGIAAIALCEAYGMTRDPELEGPAQRALAFIAAAQHPTQGGWRYSPGVGSDTSVSGWQVMALKSGELAGLVVPEGCYGLVERWLDGAQAAGLPGQYVYRPAARQAHQREASRVMTAEAMLMRQYLGWDREHLEMIAAADHLAANLPEWDTRGIRDAYYWYYATQVMFQMQGDYWRQWNERLRPMLVSEQEREGVLAGSWEPLGPSPDRWGREAGRIYVTAMHLLILEVYYRHLPLYQTLESPTEP